jgi:hypothetical protein
VEAGVGGAEACDWAAPWFAAWRDAGQRVWSEWKRQPPPQSLHTALNAAQAARRGEPAVRFVPQEELPRAEAYEAHIFRTGTCPTRENLHDFFNGLCWLQFPQSKLALNRLQAAEIQRSGTSGPRGRVRDAITVFDENGALLWAPDGLWSALLARDWRRLFVQDRGLWRDARLVIFGHALLEKLVAPRKDLTAHVWIHPMPRPLSEDAAEWDRELAAQLTASVLAQKPFTPLPVMGIPGWCAENQNFSFYDESLVFRPAGRQKNI